MKIGNQYETLLKILVTGGAGFIGRNLVEFLLEENQVVIYDDLSNSSKADILPLMEKGAKFVKGDILDYPTLQKSSKNCDMIIHLAAKSGVADSVLHPESTMDVNVNGTENVMRCCVQNKIKKIIFASSASVYADSEKPINEDSKTKPQSPYGKSKLEAEKIIKKYSAELEIDSIILRMFNVYGKGQNVKYAGVISKFVSCILDDMPIQINGDGEQTRDFVSISDVIDAFDCAIKNINGKRGNVYNIGFGKSTTVNELAEILTKISGKQIQIIHKENTNEVRYSKADTSLAKKELGFFAKRKIEDELVKLF